MGCRLSSFPFSTHISRTQKTSHIPGCPQDTLKTSATLPLPGTTTLHFKTYLITRTSPANPWLGVCSTSKPPSTTTPLS